MHKRIPVKFFDSPQAPQVRGSQAPLGPKPLKSEVSKPPQDGGSQAPSGPRSPSPLRSEVT